MPGTVGSPGTRRCNPRFQHLQTLGLPVFGLPFAMATSHFDPVACLALYIQTAPAGLRFLQRFGHPCVALGKDSKARPRRSRPSEEPPVPCTASRPAPATPPAPPRPQIAFLAGSREQGIWKKSELLHFRVPKNSRNAPEEKGVVSFQLKAPGPKLLGPESQVSRPGKRPPQQDDDLLLKGQLCHRLSTTKRHDHPDFWAFTIPFSTILRVQSRWCPVLVGFLKTRAPAGDVYFARVVL